MPSLPGHQDSGRAAPSSAGAATAPSRAGEATSLARPTGLRGFATRFARFGAVGATGVLVNSALLLLLVEWLGLHYWLAAILSIECSTVSNYLINRAWTWRDRDRSWWSLVSYHSVTLAGTVTQFTVMVLAVERLEVHYMVASLMGIAAGTVLNFIGNDRLTFRSGASPWAARRTARYALALLVMVALGAFLRHPWDSFVFEQTVTDFVGSGTTPYQTAQDMPLYAHHGWTLPVQAQWFAYPPLALLALVATAGPAIATNAPDAVVRLAIKLPAILGVLATAALVHHLVLTSPGGTRQAAARAERWILLNPLTWLIASVWGQFEPVLAALLLAAVVAARRNRWDLAGLAYAGALLVKPYAIYLAPLLVAYAWRRGGRAAARDSTVWGATAAGALSLPFILSAPSGFWHLVAGMHADRPPARFAPMAAVYRVLRDLVTMGGGDAATAATATSILAALATVTVVALLLLAALRRPANEGQLLRWMALTMTAGLLCTKVVNEQYAFLPLVLWVVWVHHAGDPAAPRGRAIVWSLSAGMAFAALVEGFHALTFVPDDLAREAFGQSSLALIQTIAASLGLGLLEAMRVSRAVAFIALLPVTFLMMAALRRPLMDGLRVALGRAPRLAGRSARVAVATLVVALVGPTLWLGLEGADASPADAGNQTDAVSDDDMPTLALVRTDLSHPEHWPNRPSGDWIGLERPADGYYTADSAKATRDLAALQASGVDGVILVVDDLHQQHARAWMMVLEEAGVPYAFALDGRDLPAGADAQAWAADPPVPAMPRWFLSTLRHRPETPVAEWRLPTYLVNTPGTPLENLTGPGLVQLGREPGFAVYDGAADPAAVEAFTSRLDDGEAAVLPWNDFGGSGALEPLAPSPATTEAATTSA